jgi:ubiquinone/menaquinone biosynthesis C-methylase UbiE
MADNINWESYYRKEPEIWDFEPGSDPMEIHRCMAAWSVFPSKQVNSLLDVGCGNGYFCHWISAKKNIQKVVGADISEGRLTRASTRYPNIEFVHSDILHLPFTNSQFDVVASIEVIEHQLDPLAALKELSRVSRRWVVITVPNREVLQKALCPYCLKIFPYAGHLHSFDIDRVKEMANQAHLVSERVRTYSMSMERIKQPLPQPLRAMAAIILDMVKGNRGGFLVARLCK